MTTLSSKISRAGRMAALACAMTLPVAASASAQATQARPAKHHSALKGAVAGAAAGHMLGHHAVAGAAVGAMIQHHRNKKGR